MADFSTRSSRYLMRMEACITDSFIIGTEAKTVFVLHAFHVEDAIPSCEQRRSFGLRPQADGMVSPEPNFILLDVSIPDVGWLGAAMVQARDAVSNRSCRIRKSPTREAAMAAFAKSWRRE